MKVDEADMKIIFDNSMTVDIMGSVPEGYVKMPLMSNQRDVDYTFYINRTTRKIIAVKK